MEYRSHPVFGYKMSSIDFLALLSYYTPVTCLFRSSESFSYFYMTVWLSYSRAKHALQFNLKFFLVHF